MNKELGAVKVPLSDFPTNPSPDYQPLPKSVLATEAIKANPKKSDREIAAEIGVGHATVSRARQSTVSHETLDQRHETLDETLEERHETVPKAEPPKAESDWESDDSIVLERQMRIAVYFNKQGHLVIRQEADHGDPCADGEDIFIYVAPQNIAEFIDKLTDIVGVGRS
jgi:hypothetical protein